MSQLSSVTAKRRRKQTGTLSKKLILATKELFLDVDANSEDYSENDFLKGRIIQCPRKDTQYWTVSWNDRLIPGNTVVQNKRIQIPSSPQNRELLLQAKDRYEKESKSRGQTTSVSTASLDQVTTVLAVSPEQATTLTTSTPATTVTTSVSRNNSGSATLSTVSLPDRQHAIQSVNRICENICLNAVAREQQPTVDKETRQRLRYEFRTGDPSLYFERHGTPHQGSTESPQVQDDIIAEGDLSDEDEDLGEDNACDFSSGNKKTNNDKLDEFPDHEAEDAVVDKVQHTLEDDTNLPSLPFVWEKWNENSHKLDAKPRMAQSHTSFHPSFNKETAFSSILNCFDNITGLDGDFFRYILKSMNDYAESEKNSHVDNKFAGDK